MAVKVPLMQSMKLCVFHEAILDERYEIQPTTNKTLHLMKNDIIPVGWR